MCILADCLRAAFTTLNDEQIVVKREHLNITDEFCISILFKRDDTTEAFTNIDFYWMRLAVCTSFFLPSKLIVCRSFDKWLSGRRRLLAFSLIVVPI